MHQLNKPFLVPRNARVNNGLISWVHTDGRKMQYRFPNREDTTIRSMIKSDLVVYPYIVPDEEQSQNDPTSGSA